MLMRRTLAAIVLVGLAAAPAGDSESSAKAALQALNDFIGDWNGSGAPEKKRPEPRETWSETVSWSWRFKGDVAWLVLAVKNGRHWKGGELRYDVDKKVYEFTASGKDGKKALFTGELRDGYLTLDRVDPATKDTERLTMNTAGDGVRFIYRASHKPDGRTLFTKDYQVACTRQGESLAAAQRKVECVVTGGLGTSPVTYKGQTYYVCCSGCRDAFNDNPEKYIKEFEKKKQKR